MEEKKYCFENYKLSNNIEIPNIGLGTWHIKEQKLIDSMIYNSYNYGYRHIDTASKYQNEVFIGNAIRKYKLNRKEIFLTSKLWNNDKGYYQTLKAFDKTLNNLQTDYLDLYLIHWPMTSDNWIELNIETWKAFEKLYKDKKIRAIGVSNFMPNHFESLMPFIDIPPMVNQIEFHPGYMQKEALEYCKKHNIIIEGWSPLGSGNILDNLRLKKIAEKYKVSTAQLCIKWCIANKVIPLPKSTNNERLLENISIANFSLDEEDFNLINNMECFYYSKLNPNIIFP